jgi:hypothetical protein
MRSIALPTCWRGDGDPQPMFGEFSNSRPPHRIVMRPGRLTHVGFGARRRRSGHRVAIQASPSALRGRRTFVTVSLILRIVSNFEQSRQRRRYRFTKRRRLGLQAG